MPDITVGYERLSDLIYLEFFINYYMFETLYLYQTLTNCMYVEAEMWKF